MEVIKFNLSGKNNDFDKQIVEQAVDVIKRGGSIVYPTDTVYGLGLDATRVDSVRRLFKIKQRPSFKPVPILVKDLEMVKSLVYLNKEKEKILTSLWPGPVTVVLYKKSSCDLPAELTGGKGTIGLRIPDHPFAQELMNYLDIPISITSANLSGEPPMTYSMEVIETFNKTHPRPDLILDAGDLEKNSPSTVIDLTTDQPKILRMGPGTKTDLLKILGGVKK